MQNSSRVLGVIAAEEKRVSDIAPAKAVTLTGRRRLPRPMHDLPQGSRRAQDGGAQRQNEKSARQGRPPARERVARLLDEGSLSEDGGPASRDQEGSGADGVVTGTGVIAGRPVAVMANDPTITAASWSPTTVEKIVRIQERALGARVPMVYLTDSTGAGAGAGVDDRVDLSCGQRGAGRILHTAVKLSGSVPQVCVLSGDGDGDGEDAYIPAVCDVVILHCGNASSASGGGHHLVASDREGIDAAKRYLSYFPSHWEWAAPVARPADPASERAIGDIVPEDEDQPFEVHELLDSLLDAHSLFELDERWAKELVVGFARLNGRAIGVLASQPALGNGTLSGDSADKGARFVQTCNAFNLALLFLVDTPRFTTGTAGDRHGLVRHAAKMISAVSQATVPKISVILRKASGAGLYAMAGPGVEPDACLALPTAPLAEDVNVLQFADAVVEPEDLRAGLIRRFAVHAGKRREWPPKRNAIIPV